MEKKKKKEKGEMVSARCFGVVFFFVFVLRLDEGRGGGRAGEVGRAGKRKGERSERV